MKSLNVLVLLLIFAPKAFSADTVKPLVIDNGTGHYKDLSYNKINDEKLSWQARTKLFGGETVHYPEMSEDQRAGKEAELKELLRRMSVAEMMLTGKQEHNLSDRVEVAIRSWLDKQITNIPEIYDGSNAGNLRQAAVGFFRAFVIAFSRVSTVPAVTMSRARASMMA